MKAVITVTGRDTCGIIADVSTVCAKNDVNILEISQTVLNDYFAMIMVVDINGLKVHFTDFVDIMTEAGRQKGVVIHTMHEDIFNSMHNI